MANTLAVDIRDVSVPSLSTINIAIINQPNPVEGYDVTGEELLHLIQIPKYWIKDSATGTVINGENIYDYFPELNPGGGGGGGYVLPTASASVLGGVKIGSGVNIDSSGKISVSGGGTITVDDAMSDTSENPVQNKVITGTIGDLDDSFVGMTAQDVEDYWNTLPGKVYLINTTTDDMEEFATIAAAGAALQTSDPYDRGLNKLLITPNCTETSFGLDGCDTRNVLTIVEFQNQLTTIDQYGFRDMGNLTTIIFPDSLTTIGAAAFYNTYLYGQSVVFGTSLKTISPGSFAQAGWSSIEFKGIETIVSGSFAGVGVETVKLPSTFTGQQEYAFGGASSLTSIIVDAAENSIAGAPWGAPNATVTWTGGN